MPAPTRPLRNHSGSRTARSIIIATIAVLCVAAALGITSSFLPYDVVLAQLDALASTGSAAGTYQPASHARVVLLLRGLGLALAATALLLFRYREGAVARLEAFGADLAGARTDARHALREWGGDRGGEYVVLAQLVLAGAALRVAYMDVPPKGDETLVLLQFAERPVMVILADYSNVGNHILHTLLMHLSWLLLGEGVWGMRLPTLLAGILVIPATYLAARGLYNGVVALVAAALVAGSSALVEYSVNGRGYVLQSLLLLCLFGTAQLLLHRERATWWAAWVVLVGLALWTLPTSAITYVGISLWYVANLAVRDGHRAWTAVMRFVLANMIAGLLTLALYSPVLFTAGLDHLAYMLRSGSTDIPRGVFTALAAVWEVWTRNVPGPIAWCMAGLLAWGLMREGRYAAARIPMALVFASWLTVFYLAFRTVGYARLWLPLAAFAYIVVAVGLNDLLQLSRRAPLSAVPSPLPSWATLGLPLLIVAALAADELGYHYVAQPDGDSFVQAPMVAAALPDVAQPGERVLMVQPVGSTVYLQLRRLGVVHHRTVFRSGPAEPARAVLALGPPGGPPPSTLLAVVQERGPTLPQILRRLGLPEPETAQVVLSLPETLVIRVPDVTTSAGRR